MNHSEVFSVTMHIDSAILFGKDEEAKSSQEHTNLSEVSCC